MPSNKSDIYAMYRLGNSRRTTRGGGMFVLPNCCACQCKCEIGWLYDLLVIVLRSVVGII